MAKLHYVKKARKAIPDKGIEVGDSYYFYKKRVNGKGAPRVCSKIKPRRSSYSTSSPFIGALMDMEDDLNRLVASSSGTQEVSSWLSRAAESIETMAEECLDKANNVGSISHLAECPSVELLRRRAEHCQELVSKLRSAASNLDGLEGTEEDDDEEGVQDQNVVQYEVNEIQWLPE